jgi:hypothetical protein
MLNTFGDNNNFLPTEDGGLYHIVADASFTLEDGTQIVYFYGDRSIWQLDLIF